jgi:hypothetical protein
MAETFSSLITLLTAEVDNLNSKTVTTLKAATVRALDQLSHVHTAWSEKSTSFSTIASQATYDSAVTGFPLDLAEITRLYYKLGSQPIEVPEAGMDDLRFKVSATAVKYPQVRSWHEQKLTLGPPPSGIITLYMDYTKDARRTSAGVVITTASTTQANEWFDRGLEALRFTVLSGFYKSPIFMDQERAAFMDIQKGAALQALAEERRQLTKPGGQGAARWTATEGHETIRPLFQEHN